jgi:hypothetical protein
MIDEIAMSSISMFLFKEATRNAFNNDRTEPRFKENYRKIFNLRLPHMDTVNDVFLLADVDSFSQCFGGQTDYPFRDGPFHSH